MKSRMGHHFHPFFSEGGCAKIIPGSTFPKFNMEPKNDDFQVRNLLFQGFRVPFSDSMCTKDGFHETHRGSCGRPLFFFLNQAFMLGAWVETTHERGYFEGFLVLKYDSSHRIYRLWVQEHHSPQRRYTLC